MIVHLFEDQKFVDVTIENFESISKGENRYIVFSDSRVLKYVNKVDQVEILSTSRKEIDLNNVFQECKLLIIHYLAPIKLYILKYLPNNIRVIWSVWGGDAYPYFRNKNLYEPLTDKLRRRNLRQMIKSTFFYDIYYFYKHRVFTVDRELNLLKKINYIITVLPYEYDIIRKEFDLDAAYIDYHYGVNKFDEKDFCVLGDSILVGNSSDYSNNHLDIFRFIKGTSQKLIVPLSYSGYRSYKRLVIEEGERMFNKLFYPITEFLPLAQYNKLLLSCNTVIMYHIRQQALGNIFMSLYIGMRVFLNKRSVTFRYLKDIGMTVFDLEHDFKLIGLELEERDKIKNRELVVRLRGKSLTARKTQEIYKLYNSL